VLSGEAYANMTFEALYAHILRLDHDPS